MATNPFVIGGSRQATGMAPQPAVNRVATNAPGTYWASRPQEYAQLMGQASQNRQGAIDWLRQGAANPGAHVNRGMGQMVNPSANAMVQAMQQPALQMGAGSPGFAAQPPQVGTDLNGSPGGPLVPRILQRPAQPAPAYPGAQPMPQMNGSPGGPARQLPMLDQGGYAGSSYGNTRNRMLDFLRG